MAQSGSNRYGYTAIKHRLLKWNSASPVDHEKQTTRELFRILRLRIFDCAKWKKNKEERHKIALHHSRRVACYHVLLHLIPLGAAATLLGMNFAGLYLAPVFPSTIYLQFVAKAHELLMQTSIVEILFAIIRYYATTGYLPLGTLSAYLQGLQVSYLWSQDYMSTLTTTSIWRRKPMGVFAIPLLVLLTATVGPSSAVLMIPRAETQAPAFSDEMLYGVPQSQEQLFPPLINSSYNLTTKSEIFSERYGTLSFSLDTSQRRGAQLIDFSAGIPRLMELNAADSEYEGLTEYTASVPSLITASLPRMICGKSCKYYGDLFGPSNLNISVSVKAWHPLVTTACWNVSRVQPEVQVPYYRPDRRTFLYLGILKDIVAHYVPQNRSHKVSLDAIPPLWIDSPDNKSLSTIGIFFQNAGDWNSFAAPTDIPRNYSGSNCFELAQYNTSDSIENIFAQERTRYILRECFSLTVCTITSSWHPGQDVVYNSGLLSYIRARKLENSGRATIPIHLDLQGIDAFNEPGFNRHLSIPYSPVLALVFVKAVADIQDVFGRLFDGGSEPGQPGSSFHFIWTGYGYGYGAHSISVKLALAVLVTYCAVTTNYLLYIIITGHSSTAWNSAIELVMLALQSRKPGIPGSTSVGIDSRDTFRQNVGIRVNDQEELELVFASDRDLGVQNMKKIVPNVAY